jgi:V/A-type H+-transporting ATPase subunit I
MMGVPSNAEMDPTPLAAITYVVVFGLMFGDLGQGLVLALIGVMFWFVARNMSQEGVRGNEGGVMHGFLMSVARVISMFIAEKEAVRHAGSILLACGLSAAFCGVLYGSLFSSEHLIPALWMRPMENIMGLFSITILMGTMIIFVGLCLNIINALINRDFIEAFLEKKGLAILVFYSSLVFMAVRYALHKQGPGIWEISVFVIAPILIFALRGVLGPLLFKAKRPHDVAEYITETIMDIVEIVLSMFANTLSFIRVGAFALSHAGLSIATFTLAGIFDPSLKSVMAISILVIGNIVIIVFEGMICGIQSMRLEFYEFFSKFFRGDGISFSPFILKSKFSEV